jgi:hypothetical protein
LLRPLRRPEPDDDPLELSPVVLAVPVAVVLAAWLNPWRAYTQGHHRSSDPQPTSSRAADHVGPLRVGDTLTNGWTIEAIHLEPDRAQLILVREGTRAIAWLRPREEHQPGSPFDTTACRIAYGETAVDLDDVRPALDALSRKIANATDDPNVVRAWLDG